MAWPNFESFCSDPQLLGEPISDKWVVFYKAVEGMRLNRREKEIFRECTGSDRYYPHVYREATALTGRRSEKTTTAIKYLLWKALTPGLYDRWVKKGRWLRIPIIAQDQRFSHDIKDIAEALLSNSPKLKHIIEQPLQHEIKLKNGMAITCYPCTFRSVRGIAAPLVLADEVAFWAVEGADDREVIRSIKPAQIQFGSERRLLKLTTPWHKDGAVWDEFNKPDERSKHLLFWQASTAYMNPRIPKKDLEEEREKDPSYFAREYEAQFIDDIDAFIPLEDIKAATMVRKSVLPPLEEFKGKYFAALDASSLTGKDRFTFGIAHRNGNRTTLARLNGWLKKSVPQVCDEISADCRSYGIRAVDCDQYSFAFLRELMRGRGVELRQLPFVARSKSNESKTDIFMSLKSALARNQMDLLDHEDSLKELRQLEARKLSGGAYRIAAPGKQRDDYATVIAILAFQAERKALTGGPMVTLVGRAGVRTVN